MYIISDRYKTAKIKSISTNVSVSLYIKSVILASHTRKAYKWHSFKGRESLSEACCFLTGEGWEKSKEDGKGRTAKGCFIKVEVNAGHPNCWLCSKPIMGQVVKLSKVKSRAPNETPSQSYQMSLAIWDHTMLPAI